MKNLVARSLAQENKINYFLLKAIHMGIEAYQVLIAYNGERVCAVL